MYFQTFVATILALHAMAAPSPSGDSEQGSGGEVVIPNDHPLIHFHGRWDASPGTWWAGSGFKLHVQDLSSLTLNLGPHTTSPLASIGVSVDYAPFYQVNVSEGVNVVPLTGNMTQDTESKSNQGKKTSVVRVNVEGWQDNRINLETIVLNKGAELLPYTPSKLAFQFIGDSLSAGQFLPQGVDQAWPFLTGEFFKAEHNVNAQPGAALSDIVSYGNEHGVSYQYFRTEDTGYFDTTDHNFTTPWNFLRDRPEPTHLVVHIGANDASQNVTAEAFVKVFTTFLGRLRGLYPTAPFFVFTPWGWPNADGSVSYYYPGAHELVVQERHEAGDLNTFLVNTTGWVTWDDVFPANQHPNVPGHQKIAGLFENWLQSWGLRPEKEWATAL
ncbi:SGNH hydrolase-type esterase domain-containing protein [Dichomitus squalens]|uniref:SGNH hydrolase-type esterase domain-containing protein n=1 Tax=Dichomitus squalens TaxID=114155 RepID=A0A4Q9M6Q2_9APHY|nr:SGNH hydrolase-type esterase domain-containing protein [Dichomitus squalens]